MRLTKRQVALGLLANAPLDVDIEIPTKKIKDPAAPKEWRLQASCVKLIREYQATHKNLRFLAAGAAQSKLSEKQKGFAKMVGYQSGWPDIVLMKLYPSMVVMNFHFIELKLPGKGLSDTQKDWRAFLEAAGLPYFRVDNFSDFATILERFCRS